MKFIKRSDLFYKTGSPDLPLDSNVANFVSIDRTKVFGGAAGDEFYGTVSNTYPVSIVPELSLHTTSAGTFIKNHTIALDAGDKTPAVVFSNTDNVLVATIASQAVEVMSFPGTIESFHVWEDTTTLIAVLETTHMYIFSLTLNGEDASDGTDTLHNSFKISRFTRVSRADIPITDYTIIDDSSTLKVLVRTENIRNNYDKLGNDIHLKINPVDKEMDFDPLRHGGMEGYIYLDNSLETAVVGEINIKWDYRYRTSAEGKKYIWVKVRDTRGIPMASQTLATQLYSDLDGAGTLVADTFADNSAYITIDDETPTTDAYGIAELDMTYIKSVSSDNIWLELDITLGSATTRVILSRRHTAAEVA